MVKNITCDIQAQNPGPPNTPYFFSQDRSITVGLSIAAFISVISALSATTLLTVLLVRWLQQGSRRKIKPLSILFAFWITMDLVQGVSYSLSFRWAILGRVNPGGAYCTAQGVLEQIGDAGTATSAFLVVILVLAQYLRVDWIISNPRTVSYTLFGFLVIFLTLLIAPPATTISNYYGNTGLWCWIGHGTGTSNRLQIGSTYGLIWLAALTSIFGYGYVLVSTIRDRNSADNSDDEDDTAPPDNNDVFTVEEATGMMWYSVAYCLETIPITVVRLVQFRDDCPNVRPGWVIFAISLLCTSGFVNALLWITTGRRFGFRSRKEIEESMIPPKWGNRPSSSV